MATLNIVSIMFKLKLIFLCSSFFLVIGPNNVFGEVADIIVWKSPTCGCCNKWIDHLKENGFRVENRDLGNTAARAKFGIKDEYGSCHTARVDGYTIEGHVPAKDIKRLLRDKPEGIGLAVPGMPIGSPGMDGPEYGERVDNFDVLLIRKGNSPLVFKKY